MSSQTLIQKILASAADKETVSEGEIIMVSPYRILSHDNSAAIFGIFQKMNAKKVFDNQKLFIALDHAVPPPDEKLANNHKVIREFVTTQEIEYFYDAGEGICHQLIAEKGHVIPGKLILGSDSHTTTAGALGAAGIPIGRTETASVWALGKTWLKITTTIKIEITGELPSGTYAKDVILHIIGQLGTTGADYKAVEFHGEIARVMSVSDRMTICNMTAEMGAKCGMFPFDTKTERWLLPRAIDPYDNIFPDEDATYEQTFTYDVTEIEPVVAKPHNPGNVVPVSDLSELKIDVALLGTCTNGRLEDLEAAGEILDGEKVRKGVRLLIYPASREVLLQATQRGLLDIFLEAGAQIAVPACGPCLGAYGGVLAPGEIAISSANRNFKGRMGCKTDTEIYLASPATVAASAITGKITSPLEVA